MRMRKRFICLALGIGLGLVAGIASTSHAQANEFEKKVSYLLHPSDASGAIRITQWIEKSGSLVLKRNFSFEYCGLAPDEFAEAGFREESCVSILPGTSTLDRYTSQATTGVCGSKRLLQHEEMLVRITPGGSAEGMRPPHEISPGQWRESDSKKAFFQLSRLDMTFPLSDLLLDEAGKDMRATLATATTYAPVVLTLFSGGSSALAWGVGKTLGGKAFAGFMVNLAGSFFVYEGAKRAGNFAIERTGNFWTDSRFSNVLTNLWGMDPRSLAEHALLMGRQTLESISNRKYTFFNAVPFQNAAQMACYLGRSLYLGEWKRSKHYRNVYVSADYPE
jgi:hypothetical protein